MKSIITLLITATLAHAQARAPEGQHRELVAAVILAESGGHGRKGMEAVYEVIHARASVRETTCAAEVLRRKQFSCLNGVKPKQRAAFIQRMKRHAHWRWVHDDLLKWVPSLRTPEATRSIDAVTTTRYRLRRTGYSKKSLGKGRR